MTWQPIRTAPKDGQKVWITYKWRGGLFVSCDDYPFLTDALAWQPVDLGKPSPAPYVGPVEGLHSTQDVDPRDAEIERLRAEVERLRGLMPTDNELGEIACSASRNSDYADTDVINKWVERIESWKEAAR